MPSRLHIFEFFSVFLLNRGILNLIYYVCYQNKSLSEVFPAIKGTNASGKLKNRYHVTPSRFLILVYNLLIKSKREYFWFQLQPLKLYNTNTKLLFRTHTGKVHYILLIQFQSIHASPASWACESPLSHLKSDKGETVILHFT